MRWQTIICITLIAAPNAAVTACFLYDTPWEIDTGETGVDGDPENKTFFMAEVTTYSSAENVNCRSTDVNKLTESFKNTLALDGWTGTRKGSYDTRPSDFYDKSDANTPYGKDDMFADAYRLAVFAGHGHIGIHGFIVTDPEGPHAYCYGLTPRYAGGYANGGQQSLFINAASCGGTFGTDPNDVDACFRQNWANSQFRQWLGFADSPVIDPTGLSTFYEYLPPEIDSWTGNVDVWLDVMEFPESGAPTAPIVYTGVTLDEINQGVDQAIHYEMNMKNGNYMDLEDNRPTRPPSS